MTAEDRSPNIVSQARCVEHKTDLVMERMRGHDSLTPQSQCSLTPRLHHPARARSSWREVLSGLDKRTINHHCMCVLDIPGGTDWHSVTVWPWSQGWVEQSEKWGSFFPPPICPFVFILLLLSLSSSLKARIWYWSASRWECIWPTLL